MSQLLQNQGVSVGWSGKDGNSGGFKNKTPIQACWAHVWNTRPSNVDLSWFRGSVCSPTATVISGEGNQEETGMRQLALRTRQPCLVFFSSISCLGYAAWVLICRSSPSPGFLHISVPSITWLHSWQIGQLCQAWLSVGFSDPCPVNIHTVPPPPPLPPPPH